MAGKDPLLKAREDLEQEDKQIDSQLEDLRQKEKDLKNKGNPADAQPLPEDFNAGPHLPGLG